MTITSSSAPNMVKKHSPQRVTFQEAAQLFQQGKLAACARACQALLDNNRDVAGAHYLLGKIAYQHEHYAEAVEHLAKLAQQESTNPAFLLEYGHMLRMARRPEEALPLLRKGLGTNPSAEGRLELGFCLADAHHFEEARSVLEQLHAEVPNNPVITKRLASVCMGLGDADTAKALYESVVAQLPDNVNAYPDLIRLLLKTGDPKAALALCNRCLEIDPACIGAMGLKYVAQTECGDAPDNEVFAPDQFIKRVSCKPPTGYDNLDDFNEQLAMHILTRTDKTLTPELYTTTDGWQTQNGQLFARNPKLGKQFDELIQQAVGAYRDSMPENPQHPFNLCKPDQITVKSWGVVLDRNGHQAPHIHPESWLSGCYYVRLPSDFTEQPNPQAGHIAFGLGDEELHKLESPKPQVFEPVEGDFLLFPGHYWHHTIPLESDEKRICIAFDIVAKGK